MGSRMTCLDRSIVYGWRIQKGTQGIAPQQSSFIDMQAFAYVRFTAGGN